jgi:hypothetical protein
LETKREDMAFRGPNRAVDWQFIDTLGSQEHDTRMRDPVVRRAQQKRLLQTDQGRRGGLPDRQKEQHVHSGTRYRTTLQDQATLNLSLTHGMKGTGSQHSVSLIGKAHGNFILPTSHFASVVGGVFCFFFPTVGVM